MTVLFKKEGRSSIENEIVHLVLKGTYLVNYTVFFDDKVRTVSNKEVSLITDVKEVEFVSEDGKSKRYGVKEFRESLKEVSHG